MFFKVRANRRVGKSKDPKTRVPEIAVPDLVGDEMTTDALPRMDGRQTVKTLSYKIFFSCPQLSLSRSASDLRIAVKLQQRRLRSSAFEEITSTGRAYQINIVARNLCSRSCLFNLAILTFSSTHNRSIAREVKSSSEFERVLISVLCIPIHSYCRLSTQHHHAGRPSYR